MKNQMELPGFGFLLSLSIVMVLTLNSNCYAQVPDIEWIKGYGNPYGNHCVHGLQTMDGGYIGVGVSSTSEYERPVGLIVKTDALGNMEWSKNVGADSGFSYGSANQVLETSDGNFIVAGALGMNGEQERALFFLDANGNNISQKTYPHIGFDAIEGIDLTEDGGIVATGFLNGDQRGGFIVYGGKCFLMKTDAGGNVEWDKTLDPVFHGMRVLQAPGGGYAVCSNIYGKTPDDLDFCLLKTDVKGNLLWHRSYGGDALENCFDFDLTHDGGYVLGGHTRTYAKVKDGWDAWLVKTDKDGIMEWHKNFGEPLGGDPLWIYDECYGVKTTLDGGYVMSCGTGVEPENVKDDNPRNFWSSYVIRTDKSGNLLWEHIHNKDKVHNAAEYINICRDGGYIVFLDADGLLQGDANAFGFMKLAPDKVFNPSNQ